MEPTIRRTVDAAGETLWVVDGCGIRLTHHQDWQAQVYLHQLQITAGVSKGGDPLHVLLSTADVIETTQTLLAKP
jgi:hypothetical protein